MAIELTDTSNVTFYTFPSTFDWHSIDDRSWSSNSKLRPRFGIPGEYEVSDKTIRSRILKVSGEFHEATQAALETSLANMNEALHNELVAYRLTWKASWYISVTHVKKCKIKRYKAGRAFKSAEVEIEFICPDPFWYNTSGDSVGPTAIATGTANLTVNANVPVPLTIQLDPTSTWEKVTITNTSDSNQVCVYEDSSMVNGDQLIINSALGTVEKDGENTVRFFSGSFLRGLPGTNTITIAVTGGTPTGTFTYSAPNREL